MRKERSITIKVIDNNVRKNMLVEFLAEKYRKKGLKQKS